MLHIIGLTLGILLLAFLLILLLILFVPIRYRVSFQKESEVMQGEVCIFWLFHFISGLACYRGEKFQFRIKIMGISIYDNTKPKKKKKRKKKKVNSKREDEQVLIEELKETTAEKRATAEEQAEAEKQATAEEQVTAEKQNTAEESPKDSSLQESECIEESGRVEKIVNSIRNKINGIIEKIKDILNSIKEFWHNAEQLKEKTVKVKELLWTDEYKKGYKKAFSALKRLGRHIKPTRLSGTIRFGAGDPYITGQIFSYAGMLYGMYGKSFNLQADFENECLEVLIKVKGRIRVFALLVFAVRLLNKEVRKAVKTIKNIKEYM